MNQQLPKFLQDKGLVPNVEINPDLTLLGTETAFDFGVKVMEVEKSGKFPQVYKFHVGDTGPRTPQPIIDVAIKALQDKQTKYGHFLGYPQVRENIAKYWSEVRGVEITKENVMLQPGGKPAIELAIQTLTKPGDVVIGQNPGYPIYESLARFYTQDNYVPWMVHKDAEQGIFEFRIEDLEIALEENKDRVKLLILNTPQNPTGMVIGRNDLEQIAKLVEKYNIMVLFDDIYDQIIFDGAEHVSFLSLPGMQERTINLNGFSKNFAMTGWRMGFIVAPEWVIEVFGKFAINKYTCVSKFNQIVAGAIFGDVELDGHKYEYVGDKIKDTLKADFAEYEKKGKFVEECLRLLAPYVVPNKAEGAFYLFPNFERVLNLSYVKNDLGLDGDRDFVYWLLEERGIANLAGRDFGDGGKGYVRFSYAEDREKHIIPGMKHVLKVVIELIEKSGEVPPLKAEEVDEKVGELENKYFV
ncbi:pyridoxal phosphate-dependent aminotransferase [Candidatus Parcubacteria bacterium]|jgi:aspartate aminotransferase|nr:pyridoxal phosphate-dependent aminotransferase [Candidatus Parcubacteria bacterium]